MNIIITGTTGMVGEGVLLTCLADDRVTSVLSVSRRSCNIKHEKLRELIIPDFMQLDAYSDQLTGYDACFYSAGVSSIRMSEVDYTRIIYDMTLHFAQTLLQLNPKIVFTFVSGRGTDSSEQGRIMWARVKGKTENALVALTSGNAYNFRPGFMESLPGQQNVKMIFKVFDLFYPRLFLKSSLTLDQVGRAMLHVAIYGYPKNILEIEYIKKIGK